MKTKTSDSPIKVYEATKEQVRLAAAVTGLNQASIVETAMNEYLERHAEEFALGLKKAREALFAGKAATIAYVLGEDAEDVARVAGAAAAPEPKR